MRNIIKIIGHPVLVMSIYLLLIIEGEHFGGFYLLYLLMALPHGALYALLALAGIIVLLIGYKIQLVKFSVLKRLLYLSGLTLMILSLFVFFGKSDRTGTMETFEGGVPLVTFIIFGICVICFLITSFNSLINRKSQTTFSGEVPG